jgi:hypothetical protein
VKSRGNLFGALVRLHGWHPDQANALIDDFAHELAEQIRAAAFADEGPGTKWNWWDAATIPASCADLIDPQAQHASKENQP